jgi:hypothetical protein
MLDLFDEFNKIISLLVERHIGYAVCGGLALAVYGIPRATIDIDLLIMPEALGDVVQLARELGYKKEALPMRFASGFTGNSSGVEVPQRSCMGTWHTLGSVA